MELRSTLFILTFLISSATFAQNCKVKLTIKEIKEVEGDFLIAFFASEENYLKKPTKAYKIEVSSKPSQLIILDDVPKGKLALSIIHDEDRNGNLNQSLFGPPSESYGFANNVMGFMGPPDFEDAVLDLTKDEVEVSINLK